MVWSGLWNIGQLAWTHPTPQTANLGRDQHIAHFVETAREVVPVPRPDQVAVHLERPATRLSPTVYSRPRVLRRAMAASVNRMCSLPTMNQPYRTVPTVSSATITMLETVPILEYV